MPLVIKNLLFLEADCFYVFGYDMKMKFSFVLNSPWCFIYIVLWMRTKLVILFENCVNRGKLLVEKMSTKNTLAWKK